MDRGVPFMNLPKGWAAVGWAIRRDEGPVASGEG